MRLRAPARDPGRTPLATSPARPLALAVLLAAGCAGARPAPGRSFLFPEAFDATQLVAVRADGPPRELLASLRRRGDDYEVALFDPVFATPVFSATSKGGIVSEGELRVEGVPAGSGARLLGVLRELYSASFELAPDGGADAAAGWMRFRLARLRAFGACVFPERIEVAPSHGPAMQLTATTLNVSCPPGRPP